MKTYLKITKIELEALIECAETCQAMGGELEHEAVRAVRAYKSCLKRKEFDDLRKQANEVGR